MTMFEWRDYLDFARVLVPAHGGSEARYRTAASRAYYAAFHKSRRLWRQKLTNIWRERIHAAVIQRLSEGSKTQRAGQRPGATLALRAHADYNSARTFTLRQQR